MFTTLLAQLPDPHSAQSLGWLALAIFGLAGGLVNVLKLVDRAKGKPPAEQLDHRVEDLEKHKSYSDDRRKAIYEKLEANARIAADADQAIRRETQEAIAGVYTEMNRMRENVASLQSSNLLQNQQLARIESKLDRFIENTAAKHR